MMSWGSFGLVSRWGRPCLGRDGPEGAAGGPGVPARAGAPGSPERREPQVPGGQRAG